MSPERATYTKLVTPLKNLLIGLSKFAQTFVVRFLKSSSIHTICINAWGSFPFNDELNGEKTVYEHDMTSIVLYCIVFGVSLHNFEEDNIIPTLSKDQFDEETGGIITEV